MVAAHFEAEAATFSEAVAFSAILDTLPTGGQQAAGVALLEVDLKESADEGDPAVLNLEFGAVCDVATECPSKARPGARHSLVCACLEDGRGCHGYPLRRRTSGQSRSAVRSGGSSGAPARPALSQAPLKGGLETSRSQALHSLLQ